ncbi:hypothetical protein AK812_SmicGene41409 [Symbiodinium microadriaticum]|uniref:WW domain-containing protein n=1 Tax=Symbiodinium microadriaticum TaxID=2951 RepID=A0A1Q9C661_SYMMI|nr:hypothetical protein AK812_SmicGene41409 [Symbiodinium microadriaticum]
MSGAPPHFAAMLSMEESLDAAYMGRGTGFAATTDVWGRELTQDGRVYYYNRATGSSQWHLPNSLYQSTALNKEKDASLSQKGIMLPAEARALLCVDCVTEMATPELASMAVESALGVSAEDLLKGEATLVLENWYHLLPAKLSKMLASGDFVDSCLADFQEVSGGRQLAIEDAAERCRKLAKKFDMDALFFVGPEEFLDLLRYVAAVRHTEVLMGK